MPIDKKRHISLELIREAICKRGYFKFGVEGSSMFPFLLERDDVLIDKARTENLRVGDIIAYPRGDILVVHRIKEIYQLSNKKLFITQGDNLDFQDIPVRSEDIIGKVSTVIRGNKRFSPPVLRPEAIYVFKLIIKFLRILKKRLNISIREQDIIKYLRGD